MSSKRTRQAEHEESLTKSGEGEAKPGVPPPPQAVAMNYYATELLKMPRNLSGPLVARRMKQVIINTIEITARAQRFADALLVDVIGSDSMDIAERAAAEKFAKVLRGELDPRPLMTDGTKLVKP